MMNVINFSDAMIDRRYMELATKLNTRLAEFHTWLADPEHTSAFACLARVSEILSLDDLRCEAAGYTPRPWQDVLKQHQIITDDSLAPFRRIYREAQH